MDIKNEIKARLNVLQKSKEGKLKNYKNRLLNDIKVNIQKKGQSVQDNQVLVDRYINAKVQPLTQMQQALAEAVQ